MTDDSNEPTLSSETSEEVRKVSSEFKWKIAWHMVAAFGSLHLGACFGIYLLLTESVKWQTMVFAVFLDIASMIAVTAGVHRLWTHRSYKARLPLRILLGFFFSVSLQYSIIEWATLHRVHHKYADTDADPHNVNRGFFFSHIGWGMVEEHPEFLKKRKTIDLRDVYADPVARIQDKYYVPIAAVCCAILPTILPMMLWEENLLNSFFIAGALRVTLCHHQTFCVNSIAHMWGYKPYDPYSKAVENYAVTGIALGEGFHNFHHAFPWDYSASESGFPYNIGTGFIDLMAWLGLAYDLKRASPETILRKKQNTSEKLHS